MDKKPKRVNLLGYITEEEKIDYYANCLGVYFGAYDEDYGYVTLEAFFSRKPVIVHNDSGGPLEFVDHGKNGFVIQPDSRVIAAEIDKWSANKQQAENMGISGYNTVLEKNISWSYVIKALLDGI